MSSPLAWISLCAPSHAGLALCHKASEPAWEIHPLPAIASFHHCYRIRATPHIRRLHVAFRLIRGVRLSTRDRPEGEGRAGDPRG